MSAGGSLLAASLYPGVPLFWSVWFTMTLVIVIYQFCWKIFLFRRSRRWQKSLLALGRAEGGEASRDQFYWVFMVPALNEEVTIIDSIERLEQVEDKYKRVIVIDDGSEDQTSKLLAAQNRPNLQVISRRLPDAQKGKAAALNAGFIELLKTVEELGWPRERVIVTIVDAPSAGATSTGNGAVYASSGGGSSYSAPAQSYSAPVQSAPAPAPVQTATS